MRTAISSLVLSSCFAMPGLAAFSDDTKSRSLISLAQGLEPLRDSFNRATDKPRVIAILSPSNKLELIRIASNMAGRDLPGSNAAPVVDRKADAMEPVEIISLAESLKPLQDRFNADKGKTRFIALLSPT